MSVTATQLARQLLRLHAAEYRNEDADERHARFEQLATLLARAVLDEAVREREADKRKGGAR